MKKISLLLLDANVVIELFRCGIWERVLEKCEIILARTVVEESRSFPGKDRQEEIDLSPFIEGGQIRVVELLPSEVDTFRKRFKPDYLDRLDPGESESLASLDGATEQHLICSSDAIVFRVLACLQRSDQGVSLEKLLQSIGLGRKLADQFTDDFREKWTKVGEQDFLCGRALRTTS